MGRTLRFKLTNLRAGFSNGPDDRAQALAAYRLYLANARKSADG